ncbi:MAG: HhH-GPD-type base excision DNA repair protein, partial [Acidimicrobiales bacterium]
MSRASRTPKSLPFTGDPRADEYLVEDPLALLIGMVLDQQVPLEKAFAGPFLLRERLGAELDAAKIAAMDSEELTALFVERPALHRFPASMAARVQDLCRLLVDEYGGNAAAVWTTAATGGELFKRVKA